MNNTEYYSDKEGEHFYRKDDESPILHVMVRKSDGRVTQHSGNLLFTSTHQKGESLINSVEEIPSGRNIHAISKEDFENALREAVFNLSIYEYV